MVDTPTPQQMAAQIIRAPFEDDAVTVQLVDLIAAALDEAGLLIDPVDNGMWQNVKDGSMTCEYRDGQLMLKLTEAGEARAVELITSLTADDEEGTG